MTDVHPFGLMLLAVVISSAVDATKAVVRSLVPSFTPKKTLCNEDVHGYVLQHPCSFLQ